MLAGNLTNILVAETTDEDLDKAAAAYNQKQEKDRNKVVCKKEAQIGTRIKKKVCRTVATIERQAEEGKALMQRKRISVRPDLQ